MSGPLTLHVGGGPQWTQVPANWAITGPKNIYSWSLTCDCSSQPGPLLLDQPIAVPSSAAQLKPSSALSPSQRTPSHPGHSRESLSEMSFPGELASQPPSLSFCAASPQPYPGHSNGLVLESTRGSEKEPIVFLWFVKGIKFDHSQS